jgi:Fic family protein
MDHITSYHQYFALKSEDFEAALAAKKNSPGSFAFETKVGGFPSFFAYDPALIDLVVMLTEKNAALNHGYSLLPPMAKNQWIRNSLIEDVKDTNEIEGIFSTKKDVFSLLEDLKKRNKSKIGSIIDQYVFLTRPGSLRLIEPADVRAIYDLVMGPSIQKSDPSDLPDGILFRKGPVGIYDGAMTKAIHNGLFPEDAIVKTIAEALAILRNKNLNFFVRVALFHFFFEFAHPFYDGNGRTGRFIVSSLFREDASALFAFKVSSSIKEEKERYYKAFVETEDPRNRGDVSTFVWAFLKILCAGYEKALASSAADQKKWIALSRKAAPMVTSKTEKDILEILSQASVYSDFGLTMGDLVSASGASLSSVNRFMAKLRKDGAVKATSFGKKDYFVLN